MAKVSKKKSATTSKTSVDEKPAKTAASQKPAPKPKKTSAKKSVPAAKVAVRPKTTASKAAPEPAEKPAKKKRAPAKTRTTKVPVRDEAGAIVELTVPVGPAVNDPIGGVIDGEAHAAIDPGESHAHSNAKAPSEGKAMAQALVEEIHADALPEFLHEDSKDSEPRPDAKLERLQKILSKAGIASRRHAEEMIVAGRVMVNGQLVTQLGAKADPGRDHIRVDGKLLAGPERHRYFVLNKPRGFVTTASDPEGRSTVMQFFEKLHERVYPVGRLDYLSEGLLLVTNDGELANQLTRAASGVEKTYLVKVAGQPTPEALERLRSGVSIERGRPDSGRVDTAPASVREIRKGDNPWFEVVIIEGRNRELRKMFEQIGHFVEKIRRVGYGPLVLDVEPGVFRELTPDEVTALRLTAEGKLKPRRPRTPQMIPKDAVRPAEEHVTERSDRKPFSRQSDRPERPPRRDAKPDFKPRFESGGRDRFAGGKRDNFGGAKREGLGGRLPRFSSDRKPSFGGKPDRFAGPIRESPGGPRREGFAARPERPSGDRKDRFESKPPRFGGPRRESPGGPLREGFGGPRREGFAARPPRFSDDRKPNFGDKPDRFAGPRREGFGSRPPRFSSDRKPGFGDKPDRFAGRPQSPASDRGERGGSRPFSPRPSQSRPFSPRPSQSRPFSPRPGDSRTFSSRPSQSRPFPRRDESDRRPPFKPADRPAFDRGSKLTITPEDRAPVSREERPAFKPDRPREQRPDSRREQRPGSRPAKPWGAKTGERGPNESTPRPPARRFSSGPPSARSSSSRGSGKPAFRPGGKSGPGRGSRPSSRPGNRKRT
jgi:23S rRNA pseudouridine2605 synthase